MPQETKNIIQLKESTSGPNFYPETHKAAIVGKEDYTYLGEVVSPGGGGGGSTGGDKPLSVSPRQSVIVGKCIPIHPRKGKKYYFGDGLIKVKTNTGYAFYAYNPEASLSNPLSLRSSITGVFDITGLYTLAYVGTPYSQGPVLVEITREWVFDTFDLNQCNIEVIFNFNSKTESPQLEVINGHIRNVSSPELWRYVERTGGYHSGTPVTIYNFGRTLFNNRLLAVKYKRLWLEHIQHLKCLVVQPKWLTCKLLRYANNDWVGKGGNSIPQTKRLIHEKPQNSKFYMNMSGRVYLYSIRRRRIGNTPVIVHFTKHGRLRYNNTFRIERIID